MSSWKRSKLSSDVSKGINNILPTMRNSLEYKIDNQIIVEIHQREFFLSVMIKGIYLRYSGLGERVDITESVPYEVI